MCGIIAHFNTEQAVEKTLQGLDCIKHRGGDGAGIATEDDCVHTLTILDLKKEIRTKGITSQSVLGHILHSTVGHVIEPFVGEKSRFVMNGEIYNWQELDKRYGHSSRNDAHAFFQAWEKDGEKCLDYCDGDYAFVAWEKNKITFGRDVIGVKPLWFYHNGPTLMIASERKALLQYDIPIDEIMEVVPHRIYRFKHNEIEIKPRKFFSIQEKERSKDEMIQALRSLIETAIMKRAQRRVGVLFSGGIDSVTVAYLAKEMGFDVHLYTAAFEDGNTKMSEDLQWARRAAEWLGLPLTEKIVSLEETEKVIPHIVNAIEEPDAIKVGVVLPFYFCGGEGSKDGMVIMLTGLGSEEIFAGYDRHEKADNANEECLYGLRWIHQRDLYRDDVVMLSQHVASRFPFLDRALIEYALTIPAKYKLDRGIKKVILREMAEEIGIPHEFAWRKKKAAQYGSNFDKALAKLAKKNGFAKKKDYLASVLQ